MKTVRQRLRSFRLPMLIVAGTGALIFIMFATRPRLEPVEAPEQVWYVDAVAVHYETIQPMLDLYGEVIAGRRSELRPAVAGRMVAVGENFRDGAFVEKGDLLIQIDPFDYRTGLAEQRSMLRESEARLKVLKRDLTRTQDLYDASTISEQFLDQSRLDVAQQEAIVEQRRIGVERAERDLADTRLRAPFAGVVGNVNAAIGREFRPGAAAVGELIDTSQIEVRFTLSNAEYGRLLGGGESISGRPVHITWKVGDTTFEYAATIARVGAEIASTSGGVTAYAVLDDEDRHTTLRPGAFVRVAVPDKPYPDTIRVPDSALYGQTTVYVIHDERLTPRVVDVLGYAGSDVILRSAGEPAIEDGDILVTTQLRDAGPGAKVAQRR